MSGGGGAAPLARGFTPAPHVLTNSLNAIKEVPGVKGSHHKS
jgi:hypothetical protein